MSEALEVFQKPLLAIVPTTKGIGIAQVASGRIARAGLVSASSTQPALTVATQSRLMIEWLSRYYIGGGIAVVEMHVPFRLRKHEVTTEGALESHLAAGAVIGALELAYHAPTKIKTIAPLSWRSSVDSAKATEDIQASITDRERGVMELRGDGSDVLVVLAVGLALSEVGRYCATKSKTGRS
jgi:hypothetical protein